MAVKKYIVIHHSATKDGATFSWGAIRKYHTKTLGWSAIGYHAGIELVGDRYEILMGRYFDTQGAHCRDANMNTRGIGICFVGNYDEEKPPLEMWRLGAEFVQGIMRTFKIPYTHVIGHREAQAMGRVPLHKRKTCPGTMFDMERFRATIK